MGQFGKVFDRLPGTVGNGFSPYRSVGEKLFALKEFAFAGVAVDQRRDGAATRGNPRVVHYFRSISDDAALPLHRIEVDPVCVSPIIRQLLPTLRIGWCGDDDGGEHQSEPK